ncbi:MAG: terminase large subunit [Bryobacteraceae bacterium]
MKARSLFNPLAFATQELGFHPDPKQAQVLDTGHRRIILNCSRQWGKSTITAVKALHHALAKRKSVTLILAPSERQSIELLLKIRAHLGHLNISTRRDPATRTGIRLPNESRILALPSSEATIRGFSATLLIIDEAARVSDDLYHSVRPMLATHDDAALCLLSTPNGRSGFFYDTWSASNAGAGSFVRISAPATECPRISSKFLAEERGNLPEAVFAQEYLCEFTKNRSALFDPDDIQAALTPDPAPLQPVDNSDFGLVRPPRLKAVLAPPWQHFYIGIDLGQRRDYSALAIVEYLATLSDQRDPVTFERVPAVRYRIRHLERFPLHTPYPQTVDHVCRIVEDAALPEQVTLAVDATGVGAPVYDMLKKALADSTYRPRTHSVTITSGGQEHGNRYGWDVPKRDLLMGMFLLFRKREVLISSNIPHAPTLIREMEQMERQRTASGGARFEPAKASQHDDLLMAASLGLWSARKHHLPTVMDPAFRMPPIEALLNA